jgi:hypothetical protein
MKKIVMGAAGVAVLTLTGLTAHASCADPRIASQLSASQQMAPLNLYQGESVGKSLSDDAAEKIVGTWHVVYTADGAVTPYAQAFIQWHSDRTEWENITMPTLSGNICMGSWKTVDRWHVSRNHVGWLFDNGIISGYFNETETVEVATNGNLYQGNNDTKGYDLTGKFMFEVKGTAAATRIVP